MVRNLARYQNRAPAERLDAVVGSAMSLNISGLPQRPDIAERVGTGWVWRKRNPALRRATSAGYALHLRALNDVRKLGKLLPA